LQEEVLLLLLLLLLLVLLVPVCTDRRPAAARAAHIGHAGRPLRPGSLHRVPHPHTHPPTHRSPAR
jgi:hypothetical protein